MERKRRNCWGRSEGGEVQFDTTAPLIYALQIGGLSSSLFSLVVILRNVVKFEKHQVLGKTLLSTLIHLTPLSTFINGTNAARSFDGMEKFSRPIASNYSRSKASGKDLFDEVVW